MRPAKRPQASFRIGPAELGRHGPSLVLIVQPVDHVGRDGRELGQQAADDRVDHVQPVDGNRHFEGRIQRFENGRVTLELSPSKKKPKKGQPEPPSGTLEVELSNIEKANLVPEI